MTRSTFSAIICAALVEGIQEEVVRNARFRFHFSDGHSIEADSWELDIKKTTCEEEGHSNCGWRHCQPSGTGQLVRDIPGRAKTYTNCKTSDITRIEVLDRSSRLWPALPHKQQQTST